MRVGKLMHSPAMILAIDTYGGNADRDAGLLEAALWQLCSMESRGCGSVDCWKDGSNEHQPKSEQL